MVRETRDSRLFAICSQCLPLSFAAAGGEAIGEHDGVSRSGACSRDTLDLEGLFFEHPPGESAVAAAALEREVDCALTRSFVFRVHEQLMYRHSHVELSFKDRALLGRCRET